MPEPTMKERLTTLEKQVSQMMSQMKSSERDWRKTIGMFSGDAEMKELFADALKLREADRRKTRRISKGSKVSR